MTIAKHNLAIETLISQMADTLKQRLESTRREPPALIGIHTGGVWIAGRIHRKLELREPFGELNIAFYRDDFSRIGMHPSVKPSNLPFVVEARHIILIDDILYTGRTIRAALNEIFDYGRPASVVLAVLVDRCERELPIQADVVGTTMSLAAGEHVKLCGPEPLSLVVHEIP